MDSHQAHLRRGMRWLGGAAAVAKLVDLATLLVVLLYLSKSAVGIASLVVAAGTVIEALDGLGTREALIQARTLERAQLDALFWVIVGAAVLIAAFVLLAAPVFGAVYGIAGITGYFIAVAAKQPIVAAAVIPLALMNRDLQYERLALVNVGATLAAAAIRLALALAGAGVWALVAGYFASGLFLLIGAQIARPFWPALRVRAARIAPLLRFGARAGVSNLLDQLFNNVHYLVIGAFYGPAELAVYRIAFTVAMEPAIAVGTLINRTALPVFVRAAAVPADLARALRWSLGRLVMFVGPFAVATMLAAGPLMRLLHDGHGHDYAAAAVPLEWLAAAALLRVTAQLLQPLAFATARPGLAARLSATTLVLLVVGLAIVGAQARAHAGIAAVAIVWVALYPPLLVWEARYLRRQWAIDPAALARAFTRPAIAALALASLVGAARLLVGGGASAGIRLGIVIAATGLSYAGLAWHARRWARASA